MDLNWLIFANQIFLEKKIESEIKPKGFRSCIREELELGQCPDFYWGKLNKPIPRWVTSYE